MIAMAAIIVDDVLENREETKHKKGKKDVERSK